MDDHRPGNQPVQPAPPSGVMDVQPPTGPRPVQPAPINDAAPALPPAPVPPDPSDPPIEANKAGLSPELLAQANKEVGKHPAETHGSPARTPRKHSNAPKAVIAVAIIVALALSAAAVFAYLKTQETADTGTPTEINSVNQPEPATTQDVDNVTKQIDEAINSATIEEDLPAEETSEQTLGL